ncbi:MAG: hypothetical protein HXY34_01520 [Candidatus Thorarchaeota archaeon]|nr:hypothetical protein [Candidatus Thorarchaeota archaeon]
MKKVNVACVCGKNFSTEIDPEALRDQIKKGGLVPLLVAHEDHFVTLYVDSNFSVRGVERVILVDSGRSATAVSTELSAEQIGAAVEEAWSESSPMKQYTRFISLIVYRIKTPEALFLAGELTGRRMWNEWRGSILRMGARYIPSLGLIVKTELKPVLDKAGKTKLIDEKTLEVGQIVAPQFVIGVAQGVLNAVSEAAESKVTVKIEYVVTGDLVKLSVVG